MLQGVIFDAEGGLVNASELHFQALNRALATRGWIISYADHRANYDGLPTTEKLNLLSENQNFPYEFHAEMLDLKQQLTRDVIRDFYKPKEPMRALFRALKQAGFRVAVASSMHEHTLHFLTESLLIAGDIDAWIGHGHVGYKNLKPKPDLYQKAMSELRLSANATAVVLQDHNSLEAAIAAEIFEIVEIEGPNCLEPSLLDRFMRYRNAA